jgi:hypothetical protein
MNIHVKTGTDYWHNRKGHWIKSFEMNKDNVELIAQVFLKRERNFGKQLDKRQITLQSKFGKSNASEIMRLVQ